MEIIFENLKIYENINRKFEKSDQLTTIIIHLHNRKSGQKGNQIIEVVETQIKICGFYLSTYFFKFCRICKDLTK